MPSGLRFERLELDKLDRIVSPIFLEHAKSAWGLRTSQYLAYEDSEEVGFLSVDRFPETDSLDICAICVIRAQRRKGFGNLLLEFAENLAREGGLRCIKLNAAPMDDGISKSELIAWYIKWGYQLNPDIEDDMFKILDEPDLTDKTP